jgi:hypothetical protein
LDALERDERRRLRFSSFTRTVTLTRQCWSRAATDDETVPRESNQWSESLFLVRLPVFLLAGVPAGIAAGNDGSKSPKDRGIV